MKLAHVTRLRAWARCRFFRNWTPAIWRFPKLRGATLGFPVVKNWGSPIWGKCYIACSQIVSKKLGLGLGPPREETWVVLSGCQEILGWAQFYILFVITGVPNNTR